MCKKRIKNAAAAHARFRFGERTGTAKRKEKEKNKMKQGKKLLSIMLAMLIAALACGLTGCIKAPGEVASAEATQTPDTALSPEPTLDTTPQTTPGDTPDITPGPTPAQSETVQPQDTGAPAPAPGDTGTPTPAPGDTGTPAPRKYARAHAAKGIKSGSSCGTLPSSNEMPRYSIVPPVLRAARGH